MLVGVCWLVEYVCVCVSVCVYTHTHTYDHTHIQHCYLRFGTGGIRRQTVGLPMGEACSGHLANFYLYTCELEFMKGLMAHRQYGTAAKVPVHLQVH